jgi:hypothetical protein
MKTKKLDLEMILLRIKFFNIVRRKALSDFKKRKINKKRQRIKET